MWLRLRHSARYGSRGTHSLLGLSLPHLLLTHVAKGRNTRSLLNLVLQIVFDGPLRGFPGLRVFSSAGAALHLPQGNIGGNHVRVGPVGVSHYGLLGHVF